MRRGSVVYFLHSDHLGSTSLTTDASGVKFSEARYLPYGQERWTDKVSPTDFTFTAQRVEAGFGLYDYNARYYSSVLGRFISPDTIVPEPGGSQGWNRYSYVYNNPLKYVDPSGNCAKNELGYTNPDCVTAAQEIAKATGMPEEEALQMDWDRVPVNPESLSEGDPSFGYEPFHDIVLYNDASNAYERIYRIWSTSKEGVRIDKLVQGEKNIPSLDFKREVSEYMGYKDELALKNLDIIGSGFAGLEQVLGGVADFLDLNMLVPGVGQVKAAIKGASIGAGLVSTTIDLQVKSHEKFTLQEAIKDARQNGIERLSTFGEYEVGPTQTP